MKKTACIKCKGREGEKRIAFVVGSDAGLWNLKK